MKNLYVYLKNKGLIVEGISIIKLCDDVYTNAVNWLNVDAKYAIKE